MKLSVIIPAYRAEKYLKEAVDSVRNQEGFPEDSQIIVIDDGSDDRTVEIARSLGALVLKQDHKGAAAARNAGLKEAEGDFILLLDADDVLNKGSLKQFFSQFEKDPDLYACFSKATEFFSPELEEKDKEGLRLKVEPYGGTLPGCSLLKREIFERIGYFNESLQSGETVDWVIRFRATGMKSVEIDYVTLLRRIHTSNTGRLHRGNEMANYARILRQRMAMKK